MGAFRRFSILRSFRAALIFGCSAGLVHLALTFFYRNNLPVRITLSDLILLTVDTLAAGSLLLAANRSAIRGTGTRIAWTVLAVGQLGRAVGDLLVAISEIGLHQTGLPPAGDVMFLLADSLFVLGLVLLAEGSRSSGDRMRQLLDLGIALIAALLVSWIMVILPRAAENPLASVALLIPVAYAVVDVLLIFALIDLLLGRQVSGGRAAILLLAGGALAKLAAGWSALTLCPPDGACLSGDWDASVWVISAVMIGLGGLLQARFPYSPTLESPTANEDKDATSNYRVYFSYVWVAAAYLLLVSNYGHVAPIGFSILLWGTGGIIGLAILRQILVLNENRRLYAVARREVVERSRAEAEIRRLNEELEQRVIARTAQLEIANRELQNEINQRRRAEQETRELQEFNESIVQNMSEGIAVEDPAGHIAFVNPAAAAQLGYPASELLGKHWTAIVPPDQQSIVQAADERRARGEKDRYELQLVRKDGQRISVLAAGSPRFDGTTGLPAGTMAVFVDITERKQAEEALALERNLLRTLIDNVPDFMYVKDTESRFVVGNLAIAHSFGKSLPEDMYGKSDFDFHPPELAAQFSADEQAVIRNGKPLINHEEYVIEPSGNQRWLITTKVPLRDSQGNIIGLVGVGRDITERKRAEEARRLDSQIMANMADGVYLIRADDGMIVYANPQFERMFGYGPGELIGKHVSIVNAPTDKSPQEQAEEIIEALNKNGVWKGQVRNLKKDGTPFWCDASVSTFTHSEYRTVWVSVHQDITARKQMEAQLQASNAELKVWVNELEQRSREIAQLGQMGDLLQSCRNAEEAYQVVARSSRLLFPAESGALFVLNNSRNLVEMMTAWGESPPLKSAFTLDDCWGLRRGRPYVIEEPCSEVICTHLGKEVTGSYLCIPMMAQGETLGVLHLRSGPSDPNHTATRLNGQIEHFTVSKRQLAATVAEHVALSLASLRLRETLRHQAIRDPLTGLFNRRYMEETIERELHRAARSGTPLGIIMFDIDHFKEFNDNFGHGAGDAILRQLGTYLASSIRQEDIACRYGGDEFILVLPECPVETASARAETLREAFGSLNVRYHLQSLPIASLSLGVAVFSAHASTAESLLRKADQALYRAKAEGRDRVVVAN